MKTKKIWSKAAMYLIKDTLLPAQKYIRFKCSICLKDGFLSYGKVREHKRKVHAY